jgi:hypothetical protein
MTEILLYINLLSYNLISWQKTHLFIVVDCLQKLATVIPFPASKSLYSLTL